MGSTPQVWQKGGAAPPQEKRISGPPEDFRWTYFLFKDCMHQAWKKVQSVSVRDRADVTFLKQVSYELTTIIIQKSKPELGSYISGKVKPLFKAFMDHHKNISQIYVAVVPIIHVYIFFLKQTVSSWFHLHFR